MASNTAICLWETNRIASGFALLDQLLKDYPISFVKHYRICPGKAFFILIADTDVVDGDSILVASFYLSDMSPKELSDAIKAEAQQQDAKFVASFDNNRAYVNEFQNADFYSYVVVPKKQKLGKYKIYATYARVKKVEKNAIKPAVKFIIEQAEGLTK